MNAQGAILKCETKVVASGDVIKRILLEVKTSDRLEELVARPLRITIDPE